MDGMLNHELAQEYTVNNTVESFKPGKPRNGRKIDITDFFWPFQKDLVVRDGLSQLLNCLRLLMS